MNKHTQQMVETLLGILDPIEPHERARLRGIAIELKQTDGEHWAVGEMLERACIFLDAYQLTSRNSTELLLHPDQAQQGDYDETRDMLEYGVIAPEDIAAALGR